MDIHHFIRHDPAKYQAKPLRKRHYRGDKRGQLELDYHFTRPAYPWTDTVDAG